MKQIIAAFNAVVEQGPLTDYELLSNTTDFDAFRRFADNGAEIVCAFNRGDAPQRLGRQDLLEAMSGALQDCIPPRSCRMFYKLPAAADFTK